MIKKENYKLITYIVGILFLLALIFIAIINLFTLKAFNQYESKLSVYVTEINRINTSTANLINDGQTIDTAKAKTELPNTIASLTKLKGELSKVNLDKKYKAVSNNIIVGLNSNILMYKQLLAIIKNPEANDIGNSINDLSKYKDSCNHYYSLISLKNGSFTLPKDNLTLINNTSIYVSELIRIKKDRDIAISQNSEFENAMDRLIIKFNSINTKLDSYAENAREKNISYEKALSNIEQNKNSLIQLESEFSTVTVPSKGVNSYDALKKVLDDYDSYLSDFYSALNNEKNQASNTDNSSMDFSVLYNEANSKYKNINKDYNNFNSIYTDFKNQL